MLYEDSVNEFGIPVREAQDPENDGWFEVDDETIDFAKAAYDEYQAATKKQEPGAILRVINTRVDEEDRPEGARRPAPHRQPKGEEDLGATTPGLPKETGL